VVEEKAGGTIAKDQAQFTLACGQSIEERRNQRRIPENVFVKFFEQRDEH